MNSTERKKIGRRKLKQSAVDYKGGKCSRCGYSRCLAALQFHHRDRNTKRFELHATAKTLLSSVKNELDKCDLLCANCHAEVEFTEWSRRGQSHCPVTTD